MDIAELSDCRLRYERAGSGPPLVFVHGYGLDHRLWDPQFASFAATHEVVRYDLRGYGASSGPLENGYTHGGDLVALLDHLDIERATFVGLSMGGQVALELGVLHPERVERLVLVDSFLADYEFSDAWIGMWKALHKLAESRGIATAKETWQEGMLFSVSERKPQAAELLHAMMDDWSGWHLAQPAHYPYVSISPRLSEVSAETLIVVGELDLPDFLAIAERVDERVPASRRVVVPGAGHVPNLEDPARFDELLGAFLRGD
jgi:pimeloyl-ACP methyl ester carboxylesterase